MSEPAAAPTGGRNKALLAPLRRALYDFETAPVRAAMMAVFAPDAPVRLAYPFDTLGGPEAFFEQALAPLHHALPDLERRETIAIAGLDADGAQWVGCGGAYVGEFRRPWLDIPPTGHLAAMRFHEFFRVQDGQVVEMQALWDIPELMMQAQAWPMSPSLGREGHAPGPAAAIGGGGQLDFGPGPADRSAASCALVGEMLAKLGEHARGGVAAMRLDRYWHPRCCWYGPAGIGACRGIDGFRNWHQIPFLNAMPDRVGSLGGGHLFAEGDVVGFTAWPGMTMTLSGDGWLGIAPANQPLTMRSLDFWRCEDGLIRENWVLVDLLDVYRQIGVDVLGRMREFGKARARVL